MQSSAEELIQRGVHAIETGNLAVWLRRSLLAVAVLTVALIYMYNFRGLATSQAMDQAQIGRNFLAGGLWYTNFVRPRAIGQLQAHGKNIQRVWLDTYSAPLPPLLDAIALFPIKSRLTMTPREPVYIGDKAIAVLSIGLFLASVITLFFTARRLFDQRLAFLACGLVLICDMLWQYSMSGLPQMLLLLLFNLTVYALVRAVEARNRGGRVGPWLVAIGLGFGLMALSHALTIWLLLPLLIICAFFFRPRYAAASIVLAVFLIVYTPWLLRNYLVCGNPAGTAIYSVLDGIGHPESGWMRRVQFDTASVKPAEFRDKFTNNLLAQSGRIVEHLGRSVVAAAFFFSLLHVFRRRETIALRWFILAMWIGAVSGMALFGMPEEEGLSANQLHVLFLPLMTCYGLAYLLVQWNRIGIDLRLARTAFITGLFLICGTPMINSLYNLLLGSPRPPVHYPPYIPPSISALHSYTSPGEIIVSDMPWAVAWYAGRRSLWVPDTVKTFTDLSDYNALGGPLNNLYLTPISGSQNKLEDIVQGEYREWAPLIQRANIAENLPFKWGSALGDRNCLFFSDRDRSKALATSP
jgi:Dolichyl-phosphate-mannose-protein mannosyltransferase